MTRTKIPVQAFGPTRSNLSRNTSRFTAAQRRLEQT